MSPARTHPLQARFIWLRRKLLRVLHWHGRLLVWLMALALLIWGGAAAWLQWWFFPHLESYRPRLVAELSQRVGRPVTIGQVQGGWQGGLPWLSFRQLSLGDEAGKPALTLDRVEASLSWWPLLIGDLRFAKLSAIRPSLALTREANGTIRIAGLKLSASHDDNTLGNWVLRQNDIEIVDGQLTWLDEMRQAPLLTLSHVDFSLENLLFGRHRVALSATPPATLAAPFQLNAHWRGDDIGEFAAWQGGVETRLQQVDLAAWGQWITYPLELRRGHGQIGLALDFQGANLTAVDADMALQNTGLRLAPELAALDVDGLSGRLRWRDKGGERELTLSDLKLSAEGGKLLDGSQASLQLHKAGGGQLDVSGLTLPALANLPPALPLPNTLRRTLSGMQPSGRLDKLSASWQGDWREPGAYRGKASFTGLGLNAPAPWPSVGPLDGELDLTEAGGQLALRGMHFHLSSSALFEQPLSFDRLRLAADWQRSGKDWTVKLSDFSASNTDIDANATAAWRWPGEGLGELTLDAGVSHLTANKVADYLPTVIGQDTRHWLKASLTAGEARDAHFTLKGPLKDFPFADGKTGKWGVVTQARGVTLAYAPAWPAMQKIDGEVRIEGSKLSIDAAGQILGTHVEHATALIEDLASSHSIQINGEVKGPSAEYFRFIAASPLDATLGGLGSSAKAAGEGRLSLKLNIPFENADATQVVGSYKLAANRLQVGETMPELTELHGEVGFTEHGVTARGLQARTLGGAVKLDISSGAEGVIQVQANGHADAGLATKRYEIPFAERISGLSDYRVQVSLPKRGWQLGLEASLKDTRIDLPAPLGKPLEETRPLKLSLDASDTSEQWKLALGSLLNVELTRMPGADGWHTERGEVHLGSGLPNTANRGLWLTGSLPELALDPWLTLLDGAGTAGAAASPALAGIELRTGKFTVAGNQLDDLALRAVPKPDGVWQLTASSKQVEGRADWAPQGKGRVHARLSKLVLPLPDAAPTAGAAAAKIERPLPAVDLIAEDFRYRDHALGRLEVKAQQQRDNWQIEGLTLANPDGRLSMQGVWQPSGGDLATKVKVEIESGNVGKLLGRFGYLETMQRGSGSLRGELAWRGSPLQPDYPSMSGTLTIKASNGQFAKFEPGVGRLLGILSLQSLRRRLTLDFRDVFSDGFAFDKIEGDSKVVRGVISTDNLTIVGPAAQVLFRGEADIARETQKLRVRIVPTVGDSLAVGAGVALANPVIGVSAFLLQRVFKDPLGRLIAYEYDVTGRWDDPQVARVGASTGK